MSEIRIITLDPDVWARGSKGGSLLREVGDRRQQCCIGVACTAFGVPDEKIAGEGCIEELPLHAVAREFMPLVSIGDNEDYDPYDDNSAEERIINDNLLTVYNINDSEDITDDHERVRRINAELERLKASFRFALKGAGGNPGAEGHAVTPSASAAQK